jgi:protocatechuate 3,4-dioxygenase beta subunit
MAQTGAIEGTVVDSAGMGIAGASVYFGQTDGTHYETTTDAAGLFRITGVNRGEYGSHFEKDGFVPYYSGSDPMAKPVRAGFGQDTAGLRIELSAFGSLRGRVLDPDGNPVARASVDLAVAGTETTDDQGRFTFEKLKPGTYSLMARVSEQTPKAAAGRTQARTEPRTEMVPTWFPSAAQSGLAERILIRGGAQLSGYDIRLRTAPVFRVRGKVLDAGGKPLSGAMVTVSGGPSDAPESGGPISLLSISPAGVSQPYGIFHPGSVGYFIVGRPKSPNVGPLQSTMKSTDEGTFEFPSVRAGTAQFGVWRNPPSDASGLEKARFALLGVTSSLVSGNPALKSSLTPEAETSATVDRDIDDLEIRLPTPSPPFTLTGSAELQSPNETSHNLRGSVTLAAETSDLNLIGMLKPEGVLHMENLSAGQYRVLPVPALPDGVYLDSVMLGEHDVTGQSVYLGPGSPPLRLVYKTNGGGVRGKVENGSGATLVLIPETTFSAALSDYGWVYPCDSGGAYALTGLKPGGYYAWAFDVTPQKLPDLEDLRGLVPIAASVRIEEGVTGTLDLKISHVAR